MRAKCIIATAIVLAMLGAGFGAVSLNASAAVSAVDSFGYKYTDSKAPEPSVVFNWVEIRGTGTDTGVYGDDTWGGPLQIGFDFYFYGERYSAFNISTNCYVMFGYGYDTLSNRAIPYSSSPNGFIAPYWDDMYVDSGEIVYQNFGSAPNRQLVIEFFNVTRWAGSSLMTFEIILYESTDDILIQYLTMNGNTGSSATAGIENQDGTIGLQYCYNSDVLQDNLAVLYSLGLVSIGPSQDQSDRPGETVTYDITVVNRQAFADSFAISFSTMEGWPTFVYDSLMNPLADNDGDGQVDTGTLPSLGRTTLLVTVEIPGVPTVAQDAATVHATSFTNSSVNASCTLTTGVLAAWLTPPHSDYGEDSDSDGDYNYLVVDASIHVYASGTNYYYIYGELRTSTMVLLASGYASGTFGPGDYQLSLRYNGWLLRDSGLDGPYNVQLYLYDSWGSLLDTDVHYTDPYSCTEFMEVPGSFASPFSDMGIDTDEDGLYDYLAIDAQVDANYDGEFRVDSEIYDSTWTYLDDVVNTTDLQAGLRTVRLLFDPWAISREAVGGIFHSYSYLYADVDGSMMYMGYYYHATASYDIDMFERPWAMFEAPHSEHVVDDDSDLLYDYLVIDAQVNASEENDYLIVAELEIWGSVIDTVEVTAHLVEGVHIVEIAFPGWPIRYYGGSGSYDVEMGLYSQGLFQDDDSYATASYSWNDFETEPALFEPPHNEYGLDDDADSYYDYLVVEIAVNVSVSGVYRIDALLEDWWGHDIESVTSIAYLDATVGHVEVRFIGWLIYSNYEDGPFYVYMELYDDDGRYLDDDSLTTTAYGYTDFEGIPAQLGWPHSCYASNDDADPAYDRLVVEATVEVISAGTFYLQCYLYDDGWDYVGLVGVDATLAQGSPIVELSYPGWLLYTHGWSGAYYAYIYLYDERGNYLDSGSVASESLAWSDFDPTVPRIDSPYASSAPAIDGRMDTAEWDDAVIIELSETDPINGIDATMLIMNDETTLFICVDAYGDTTQDEWDYMSVAFDTGNDDIFTDGEEDQFVIRGNSWSPQEHYVYNSDISYWELHCSPFEHSGLLGVVGFSATAGYPANHRVYELAIPLSLLGASQGDVLGFIAGSESYYGLYDAYESRSSAWPMQLPSSFEIEQFGELALAENIVIPPPTTTAAPAGTSGSAGWFLSGVNVTLSATGGDGGVDYTQYRLDGGSWTTYSVPISVQTDGVHSLEYRSVDNAGQVEATKTLAVKIDRVASVTTGAVSGSYVWLNATDATSGVGTTKYRIDGGTWQTYSGVLNVSGEGKHTVEFHSVDAAGNAEATHSLEVEVENGQGSAILGDWTLYIVLAIIAIIAIISIGAIFGMRRRARESDAKAAIKDVGSPVSQMMEEEPPKPPDDE